MNEFSHLSSSKVNLSLVQEQALNELIEILDKVEGTKVTKQKQIFCFFFNKFFSLGFNVG